MAMKEISQEAFKKYTEKRGIYLEEHNKIVNTAIENKILTTNEDHALDSIEKNIYNLDIDYLKTLHSELELEPLSTEVIKTLDNIQLFKRTEILNLMINYVKDNNYYAKNDVINALKFVFDDVQDIINSKNVTGYTITKYDAIREATQLGNHVLFSRLILEEAQNKKYKKLLGAGASVSLIITLIISLTYLFMKNEVQKPTTIETTYPPAIIETTKNINKMTTYAPTTTRNPTSTSKPNAITQNNLDTFKILALWCYINQTTGCFMVRGSSFIPLTGCNDWYGESTSNMLKCNCGDFSQGLSKSACDNPEECLKPYCIGNSMCSQYSNSGICTTDSQQTLYRCTSGAVIGDPNYVYYTYINDSVLSIIGNAVEVSNSLNVNSSFNIMKYIPYIIYIVITIFFIIVIVKIIYKHLTVKK